VVEHSINLSHRIKLNDTTNLAKEAGRTERIIREATDIELHSDNTNRKENFFLSRSLRPLIRRLNDRRPSLGTSDYSPFSGPTTPRSLPPFFTPLFFLLSVCSFPPCSLSSFRTLLLGPFSGPFLPTFPILFFLPCKPSCIFLSLVLAQGTLLQRFLLARTITHLNPLHTGHNTLTSCVES